MKVRLSILCIVVGLCVMGVLAIEKGYVEVATAVISGACGIASKLVESEERG